jgi:hypothetical protein
VQKRDQYRAILNGSEAVLLAARAYSSARGYRDFLIAGFSELKLPIRTVRPDGTEGQLA